ncbi:MAG: hypothetical protein AB1411_02280 [Nitrospirota bacterium]
MSIQFSDIHNLVRTYQRVLNLDQPDPVKSRAKTADPEDRVSISLEARGLQHARRDAEGRDDVHDSPPVR